MTALALEVITDSVTFVEHVIRDGRFVHQFQRDPHGVAQALGIEISPEVAATVSSNDVEALLKRLPPVSLITQIGADAPVAPRGNRKSKQKPVPKALPAKKTPIKPKKGSK